ncbi:hypothetical protein [Allokutzneria albata]|uniref:Uncharacterized protein n=1 Tax=Allokutzneria albata TaxID=211114 RepID=A0A1H0BGB3_ALLAB|nr:hypothetical protein [Allokutzneria albata]SDN44625.1 hypothetical protein SAMN04489726_6652 [Allokutzneria albata]
MRLSERWALFRARRRYGSDFLIQARTAALASASATAPKPATADKPAKTASSAPATAKPVPVPEAKPNPFPQQTMRPPAQPNVTTLATRLPSFVPGTWFDASFTLRWESLPGQHLRHSRPEEVVRAGAAELVAVVARCALVTQVEAVQAEANRRLGLRHEFDELVAVVGEVTLSASEAHIEATEEYERLRRAEAIGELRRKIDKEEMEHLRSTAFTDVRTARVWWAYRHPERIHEIASMDEVFARLCGADARFSSAFEEEFTAAAELPPSNGHTPA